jgi:dihydroorotase
MLIGLPSLHAQQYDLLLKGGHVIDPKNKIDAQMDVAVTAGKIAAVAANVDVKNAKQVIDVTICMCMFSMALMWIRISQMV